MPERAPPPLGRRGLVLAGALAAGVLAYSFLDLSLAGLVPRGGQSRILREFLAAALRPALDYEASFVPPGTPSFPRTVLAAVHRTLVFAAAALSVSLPLGLVLGFCASSVWWSDDGGRPRRLAPLAQWSVRLAIAGMRSVHELLWAVVFLAAFGLNTLSAVAAISIPFAGTLAKVFSEMLDEAPRNTAFALRAAGASPLRVFLFGLVPRALPDMAAYTFYRFECAVRSSAVLGFFGYETLGYYLKLSFDNLHYREVWTYLYVLFALVLAFEAWSGALRQRFVA